MINSKYFNYLILLLFIGLWSSIGSDPYNFLFIFESKESLYSIKSIINFKNFINFFRALFPIICLVFCLIIILKYKFFRKQKKFIYILLLIQIAQILSTFFSKNTIMSNFENSIDHIGRYHWTISSIASLFIFMIASRLKNFDMKKLFYISIFYLILIVLFFSSKNIYDFYLMDIRTSLYNLNVLRENAYFFDHQMPRVTGISRSIIFLYVIFFFINLSFNQKYKFITYTILIFLGGFIFLYQSKYAIVSFIIINVLFYFNFLDKKKGRKIIILLFISQIVVFFSLSSSRIIIDNFKSSELQSQNQELNEKKNKEDIRHFRKFENLHKKGIGLAEHIILSGRAELWLKAFDFIKHRPFLGYGSMSDRHLLNKERIDNNFLVNPVSNAFIYSLISGGVFSLLLFIFFWINIREKIFNIFSIKEISNNYNKIGITLLCLIGLRCLIENSVMLFGVDYLILLNALYLTENK